jgi:DNA-binding transcriptional ArsR family regulator
VVEVPGLGAIVEQIKARIGQIEEQLRQHRDLSDELERLRDALSRLEGGVAARVRGVRTPAKASSPRATPAAKKPAAAKRSGAAGRPRRVAASAPRGQTRAKVLDALKDGPMTAGEIAAATGIGRGSASTTLTKLAKSGDVVKAERGYRLPD